MKIASWNVNSLRVRLPQVMEWAEHEQPDLLALQETKLQDVDFPQIEIQATGYEVVYSGQKTYNGVAILSKSTARDVVTDIEGLDDPQRRIIAATYGDLRLINLYVPNGERVGSPKYEYKLEWLNAIAGFVRRALAEHEYVVVVGDFNIAPDDRDVHDPISWAGEILCSEAERQAFWALTGAGLVDSFRLFEQAPDSFSWWDYRAMAFRRNRGLRIDHILISDALRSRCLRTWIDKEPRKLERPSDHAPTITELALQ